MPAVDHSGGKPVTLEQLLALNDELIALVRAGVSLELGLRQIGPDLGRGLEPVAHGLAVRLERGEGLAAALADDGRFPPAYCALIEAGVRTGSLPRALEAVSSFAQVVIEIRRKIGMAFVYPSVVFLAAYALFMAFLWEFVPRMQDAYLSFHLREHDTLQWLGAAARTAGYWGPVLPVGMALLMGWWIFSQRATFAFGERLGDPLNQVPILRGVMRQVRIANFSELLALMVEHQIPLADGLLLAGAASGDRRIKAGAVLLAEGQNRGESLEASASTLRVFPPFLRWILMSAQKPETLVPALHQTAEHYRRRAERRADWVKLVLPVVAVVVVGGGATFLYTLALFLPLRELLTDLGLS